VHKFRAGMVRDGRYRRKFQGMTDLERLLVFVERGIAVADADLERYKFEQRGADARYMRGYVSSGYVIRQEILRIQRDGSSP